MNNEDFPPLGELIAEINHQIEAYPESCSPKFDPSDGDDAAAKYQSMGHRRRGNQFIRFNLHKTHLALPLEYATEILSKPEITPLPNLPGWVLGICNVRGEIVSVVELSQILGIERNHAAEGLHLILLQIDHMKIGFLVDRIGGIFFDQDPEHAVEENELTDKGLSRFARSTFTTSDYEMHLLDMAKLSPVLRMFK